MKSIIVPTDFSDNAANALDYAVEIARVTHAKITILHTFQIPVMDTSVPTFMVQSMVEEEEKRCEKELSKIAQEISQKQYKDSNESVNCEYLVKQGFAVEEILYYAEKKDAGMIIMGTQGASGLKRIILGSNTSYVIERTHIPVIAVPENAQYRPINQVAYATELQEGDENMMHRLVDFCKNFDASIKVLHIGSKDDQSIEERLQKFKDRVAKHEDWQKISYEIISNQSVPDGISKYIEEGEVDLIAMVTKKRNLFQQLFNPSLTKNMAFHSKVPLLAFQFDK